MSLMSYLVILALLCPAAEAAIVRAAQGRRASPEKLWTEVSSSDVSLTLAEISRLNESAVSAEPSQRLYVLDVERMNALLRDAPRRMILAAPSENGREITLPLPDGRFQRFSVFESSVLPPSLAETVPEIKTFSGKAIGQQDMTATIEHTVDGWSAMVLSAAGITFVTPLLRNQKDLYVAAAKSRLAPAAPFRCFVEGSVDRGETTGAERKLPKSFGGSSRSYRLAVAATGEYTAFFRQTGDTDDQSKRRALGEIVRLVSRLNQVYSRELAIQFTLVGKELDIIYTDPAKDPYTNDNASRLLDENQTNLDKIIGANGYDIGHVVGTGGGGLASVRSTCVGGSKARGETGSDSPTSDSFYIDYVAHEIGHQFGGNHTFNATSANCAGNRRAVVAYEPGSGTTIMGYAGICGSQNVATNSSDYFHAVSFDEVIAHITGSGSCVTPINNGDRPPTVTFADSASMLVPAGTPFVLRAAGTDPDGDALQYSFEQYDLGDPSPPDDDSDAKLRPMFRSVLTPAAIRTFPSIANIAGAVPPSKSFECLPMKASALSFRVLARDQRGGFAFADAAVAVVTTAGPFRITSPTDTSTWKSGQTQTVTWDVAGTASAPLSCDNVRISVSLDGGATFDTLVASTPNDGGESVTIPAVGSARKAILRVDGIAQAFFAATPRFSIIP